MNVHACRLVALNPTADAAMTAVGFEPTQLSLVELECTPIRPLGQTVAATRNVLHFLGFQEPPPNTLPETHTAHASCEHLVNPDSSTKPRIEL